MMKTQVLFSLTIFLTLLFSIDRFSSTNAYNEPSKITIHNYCPFTIWPGIHTLSGKRLNTSGFSLGPRSGVTLHVDLPWTGRIWGRTHCSWYRNRFHCKVGDCGSGQERCYGGRAPEQPVSMVDLNMALTSGRSFFAIDLKDGANVRVNVAPMDTRCSEIQCYSDLTANCPDWLAKYDTNGDKIACKSACLVTGQPKHCCTGAYSSPHKCMLNPYSEFIKEKCPSALSYRYDNKNFSCFGGCGFGVYFCG